MQSFGLAFSYLNFLWPHPPFSDFPSLSLLYLFLSFYCGICIFSSCLKYYLECSGI
jgi:hypothetical protein